jgi:signal transduction histidine kinase
LSNLRAQTGGTNVQAPESGSAAEPAAEDGEAGEQGNAKRIVEAADAERRRVAQDLHDGAQQKFVAAVNNLKLARARLGSQPDSAERYLDAALAQSESGLRALRELVGGIYPPILTHMGLPAAVEALADGFPIPVSLEITSRRFGATVEENIYFFVAEALTNVIKHARAGEARVMIAAGQAVLTVEVSDDGVGVHIPAEDGYGLAGLTGRMQALGGEFTVAAPPGGGTVLRGVVPVIELSS